MIVSPARFARATQKVRGFSSVTLLAGKLSSADEAVAGFRYDSSIQPVNSSSLRCHFRVGAQCGKSPNRVSAYMSPSASNPAGCIAIRRSKFQFTATHGVPVFHQLPCRSWKVLPCPAPATNPPGL